MSPSGVWALVPAKSFDRGKSRLSPALSDGARVAFARALFDHVLGTLAASQTLDGILVATDSPTVAEAARALGAAVRLDPPGATTLAEVIDRGLGELAERGARTALVLMADLPRLLPDDVRALLAESASHPVVIARASDGVHTNALALSPPDCLATAFGRADSFAAHLAAARAAGLAVAVIENPRLAFDVDGPEDHARLLSRAP
jgi:2-phospho-L-lactate guanylyltransferase